VAKQLLRGAGKEETREVEQERTIDVDPIIELSTSLYDGRRILAEPAARGLRSVAHDLRWRAASRAWRSAGK
jgi:hypothetical protein